MPMLGVMCVVVGVGFTGGTVPPPSMDSTDATLAYTCHFPSGAVHANVRIATSLPPEARAGDAIDPGPVTMTVTLPHPVTRDLPAGTRTVTGTAQLSVKVAQQSGSSDVKWPVLTDPNVTAPAAGSLVLSASGQAKPVTADGPGEAGFTAGDVSLVLTSRAASGTDKPEPLPGVCTPDQGQATTLGTVATSGAEASNRRSAAPSASSGAARTRTTSAEASGWPGAPIDPALWNTCSDLNDYTPIGPVPVSAYLAGWSDTSKLGQALTVGYPTPALAENAPNSGVWQGGVVINGVTYECSYGELRLDYHGARQLPPATASFTGFGFMPITATAFLAQYGTAPIKLVFAINTTTGLYSAITSAPLALRIGDVKVNGTTFDVGDDCRTAGPLTSPDSPVTPGNLVLSGGEAPGDPEPLDTVVEGGAMAGLATIPDFTGCVTPQGENLDALLDASISGPGNTVKVDQGPLCGSAGLAVSCKNGANMPTFTPLWTISHGGQYHASGSLTLSQPGLLPSSFFRVTCDSQVAGDIPEMTGAPRGATGTFGWTGISGCTATTKAGAYGSTWTVTQEATPSFDLYMDQDGVISGYLGNVSLSIKGTGVATASGTCTIQLSSHLPVSYSDSTSTLAVTPAIVGDTLTPVSNNCPAIPLVQSNRNFNATFSYPLSSDAQITSP
jgi:hypothetical protein